MQLQLIIKRQFEGEQGGYMGGFEAGKGQREIS